MNGVLSDMDDVQLWAHSPFLSQMYKIPFEAKV